MKSSLYRFFAAAAACVCVFTMTHSAEAAWNTRLFSGVCLPQPSLPSIFPCTVPCSPSYYYLIGPKVNLITEDMGAWTKGGNQPPAAGWVVEDGTLIRTMAAGDIISKNEYENFILEFSWTIDQGGNAGIKYRLKNFPKPEGGGLSGWLGIEYQLLDDFNSTGEGKNPVVATASMYHILPVSKDKVLKPHDEINYGKIVVMGNSVEHWLNGKCVRKCTIGSQEWKKGIQAGKFRDVEGFGLNTEGRLLLQDHGAGITFHTLTIREVKRQSTR